MPVGINMSTLIFSSWIGAGWIEAEGPEWGTGGRFLRAAIFLLL